MKFRLHINGFFKPARLAIVAGLLGMAFVTTAVFTSCQKTPPVSAVPHKPFNNNNIPEIRVRLTHKPIQSIQLSSTGPWRVLIDGKEMAHGGRAMKSTECLRSGGRWNFGMVDSAGRKMTISCPSGRIGIDGRLYRGDVVLLAEDADNFWVQNNVDMESYLASVVAKELYPRFHPEAYKAQAIAARTFAIYEKSRRRKYGTEFDVWASQRSQVYFGSRAETDKSWAAVRDTHGQVLKYGPAGKEDIFLAQFSACNGGFVNGAHLIRDVGEQIEPIKGGQYDGKGKDCPYYAWADVKIPKRRIFDVLAQRYPRIAELRDMAELRVKSQTPYGRAVWLEVVNSGGQAVPVRAEDVQICLRRSDIPQASQIYSMNCKIRNFEHDVEFYDGRGFGHGVGLSQWGAEERAADGETYEQILNFYYPGAKIMAAY